MENIIVFNYIIVLFSVIVLLGFFIYNVNHYYRELDDLNKIVDNSDKICVKIDYNGRILNYNSKFAEISYDPSDNSFINQGILSVVNFKDTSPILKLISEIEESETSKINLEIITFYEKTVNVSFNVIINRNIFNVINEYILVGTDVTEKENLLNQLSTLKEKNRSLHSELTYSEEELQRNFEQIRYKQNEVNIWCEKHRLFMDSTEEGVLEYDFYSRQFFLSRQFQLKFLRPDQLKENILNYNELLVNFVDAIEMDCYINLLEKLYISVLRKVDTFEYTLIFKKDQHNLDVRCDLFLDKNGDFFYFIMSTKNNNRWI